jgi:hypothetical protein
MRGLLGLVPVTVFALASCGTAGSTSDPANTTASSGRVATCHPTCATASDCGVAGDALYDSSHFSCQKGECQWLGCKSAAECTTYAHGGTFVCRSTGGAPPSCDLACRTAADCVPPGTSSAGLEDASHFACTDGACVWLGCRSTAECTTATRSRQAACDQPTGAPVPTCVPTCTTAADCATTGTGILGDASHYACKANRCVWLGCKSTTECTTALASSKYVCD